MLLDDVANLLEVTGIAHRGQDLYLGDLPDAPDQCVALFEYSGGAPEALPGLYLQRPRLQVRVRSASYQAARELAERIERAMNGRHNLVQGDTLYVLIQAIQSPGFLGRDDRGRAEFVQNFAVIKEG